MKARTFRGRERLPHRPRPHRFSFAVPSQPTPPPRNTTERKATPMTDHPLDPREDVTGFLALMPSDLPPALPLIDEGRRAVYLEDAGRTLARMGAALFTLYPLTTPAQVEAGRVFTFAGSAWAVFLEEVSTPPAVMASRVRLWAHDHGTRAAAPLGTKEAGACAAWWAVATFAAWCAYEGFTDRQAEDLCVSVLEGLEDPAPRTLN